MEKNRKPILVLLLYTIIFTLMYMPVSAAIQKNSDSISTQKEFVITSDMVDEGGNFSFKLGEKCGFKGKVEINNNIRKRTADFKLTGRFYKTSDGSTVSDFWLSSSFYVSSNRVYVDSYDSRHTKRTGFFSGYEANISDTIVSGEGTSSANVRAEFELLLNGKPSPGISHSYLQIIYFNTKEWKISGNYDGANTP